MIKPADFSAAFIPQDQRSVRQHRHPLRQMGIVFPMESARTNYEESFEKTSAYE